MALLTRTRRILASKTCRQCRFNTQQPSDRSRQATIPFTPLPTLQRHPLRSQINSAITNPTRAPSSHRGTPASVMPRPADQVQVLPLRLRAFLAPTAARSLPAMTCFVAILPAKPERLLSPHSIARRAATNVPGPRQDAISRSLPVVDAAHEASNANMLLDPATRMSAKRETLASCLVWMLRCIR